MRIKYTVIPRATQLWSWCMVLQIRYESKRHLSFNASHACAKRFAEQGPIEGFHVTSYHANFASHPTRWFPFAWPGIGKYNKMSRYSFYSLYHFTKSRPSDKNIETHTRLKIQILLWSKSKEKAGFDVFFFIPRHTGRKPRSGAKSWAHRCVQRRENPLFIHKFW